MPMKLAPAAAKLSKASRPGQGKPLSSRGTCKEMSKRFPHKFLLNDTFAPAERFNPELALGTVSRTCPRNGRRYQLQQMDFVYISISLRPAEGNFHARRLCHRSFRLHRGNRRPRLP